MNKSGIDNKRIALTGFMGVGKSTVSRHLSKMLKLKWADSDVRIEKNEGREIAEIVEDRGLDYFRSAETSALKEILDDASVSLISLGGGAFTVDENRDLLNERGVSSIWLGATFEHCWANISSSYKDRPLARDRKKALKLFEDREKYYCLAEWHFLIMPGCNSFAVASQIAEQVYGLAPDEWS
ncbi:MAG: AAA family ATPase [Pyrinomonadaceae bacterium]|nr:AAA family ATPase [Pyrinomonadaceae bacterium]